MSTKPVLATIPMVALLCLVAAWPARTSVAAEARTTIGSELGRNLLATIEAGIPFQGTTSTLDGTQVWPGFLYLRIDEPTLAFDGHVEWTSLNHVNYVEGTIIETGDLVEVVFTASKVLVKGSAGSGVNYRLAATMKNGQMHLDGQWFIGNDHGPCAMVAQPGMAGQQSSLLAGRSIDDLLDAQPADNGGKSRIVWRDDCLDWKVDGFEYPNGQRFVKMSCNWARDRLASGASTGEAIVVLTKADDSPLFGFRHEHSHWTESIASVDHLDITFSQDVRYRLPVKGQKNGWAYSTDPEMVQQIIRSADADAQHIDSDMTIDTGLKGGTRNSQLISHISTRGLKVTMIQAGYFMRGEQPPPAMEIMQRDDN